MAGAGRVGVLNTALRNPQARPADREEYRAGFFAWQDALWKKINLRNDRQSYQDDFFRMDLPTFDEVPVREAILNAGGPTATTAWAARSLCGNLPSDWR